MHDDILTPEEAGALLKVDSGAVAALLEKGELPGRKIGGAWRTTKRALISYVDGVPLQMAFCCAPASDEEESSCCQPAPRCCS